MTAADVPPLRDDPGARRRRRTLSDTQAVLVAVGAAAGAWAAVPEMLWPGAIGVTAALVLRRPVLLIVAVAVLAAGLGGRATQGLAIAARSYTGQVEVLHTGTTPRGDVHAEVRAHGHHFDLYPPRGARRLVQDAWTGDRLRVQGRLTPADPTTQRDRGSHIAARLHATEISRGSAPRWPWRVADGVRSAVRSLARPLPRSQQALFDGFVLGDASGQSSVQQADFRASGLTHLLVASGENVAFVLVLASPVLLRVGLRTRWALTLALLAGYGMVTGLEPSVLRAAAMAAVATTGAGIGRPARSWRSLGLAIGVLVLVDPFLVHSTSFVLSVCASAGILTLARPVVGLLSGPLWLRRPLSVTIAAQIGVAPLLLGFPGGLPVATLPANLLAAVPAGLVMVLGLPALVVAATHLPGTSMLVWIPRLLLGWVDGVARRTAAMPLGYLGGGAVAVAVGGLAVALYATGRRWSWIRRGACAVACLAVVSPLFLGTRSTLTPSDGLVILRKGTTSVVVLTATVPSAELLTGLSTAKLTRADLVVVPHGDATDAAMLDAMAHRCAITRVLTPHPLPDGRPGSVVARPGERFAVGDARIEVVGTTPELAVHVTGAGAGDAEGEGPDRSPRR